MIEAGIHIEHLPELRHPLLIAGFDGWGNALDVSSAMAAYLIRSLDARRFAAIDADLYYRYDQARPHVKIEAGMLKHIGLPGGAFYAARNPAGSSDLVVLKADEPHLRWHHFGAEVAALCSRLGVATIITLGSMYDNVLHTDWVVSGLASPEKLSRMLKRHNVLPIDYQGPSAVHTILHAAAEEKGLQTASLWCHCPYYLQGTTHYGIMARLGALLGDLAGFELDLTDLKARWDRLDRKLADLIANNSELKSMIEGLRKARGRGLWAGRKPGSRGEKVINIQDYLDPI